MPSRTTGKTFQLSSYERGRQNLRKSINITCECHWFSNPIEQISIRAWWGFDDTFRGFHNNGLQEASAWEIGRFRKHKKIENRVRRADLSRHKKIGVRWEREIRGERVQPGWDSEVYVEKSRTIDSCALGEEQRTCPSIFRTQDQKWYLNNVVIC